MSNRSDDEENENEELPFMEMDEKIDCPEGTHITNKTECEEALNYAKELGIVLGRRKHLVSGSWSHVPSHCSYQAGGDQAFHFNRRKTSNVKLLKRKMYQMICKTGNAGNAHYTFILLVFIEEVRIYI